MSATSDLSLSLCLLCLRHSDRSLHCSEEIFDNYQYLLWNKPLIKGLLTKKENNEKSDLIAKTVWRFLELKMISSVRIKITRLNTTQCCALTTDYKTKEVHQSSVPSWYEDPAVPGGGPDNPISWHQIQQLFVSSVPTGGQEIYGIRRKLLGDLRPSIVSYGLANKPGPLRGISNTKTTKHWAVQNFPFAIKTWSDV